MLSIAHIRLLPLLLYLGLAFSAEAADYLGTPVQMYDHFGQLIWDTEYDSYGNVRKFRGSSLKECPFRWPGQYADEETGLYYNRFRYYGPNSGSYLSQDPIGLAGNNPNFYAYVPDINSRVDPLGLTNFTTWLNQGVANYSNYISDKYTGITNDFFRRVKEHAGNKGVLERLKNTGNLTKNQARAVEQAIIKNRGGVKGAFLNLINSISPKRNIYKQAVEWGEDWLRKNDSDLAKKLGIKCKG